MVFDILLLIILSNIFPKLLAKVIPLSFEHFPFVPLPLYSRIISPVCHWVGILCVCIILFIVCRYMCFTFGSAFVNISFGILSGPVALLFFICFIVFVSSFIVAFFRFVVCFCLVVYFFYMLCDFVCPGLVFGFTFPDLV